MPLVAAIAAEKIGDDQQARTADAAREKHELSVEAARQLTYPVVDLRRDLARAACRIGRVWRVGAT